MTTHNSGDEIRTRSVELDAGVVPGNNSTLFDDVSVNGTSIVKHAPLFTLDGSTLKPLTTSGGTAALTRPRVLIFPAAAHLLNEAFKTTGVKAGLLFGVATIVVDVK